MTNTWVLLVGLLALTLVVGSAWVVVTEEEDVARVRRRILDLLYWAAMGLLIGLAIGQLIVVSRGETLG